MRDPNRITQILKKLEELWNRNTDLRLGQLIFNLNFNATGNEDVFFIEDDILLNEIEDWLK